MTVGTGTTLTAPPQTTATPESVPVYKELVPQSKSLDPSVIADPLKKVAPPQHVDINEVKTGVEPSNLDTLIAPKIGVEVPSNNLTTLGLGTGKVSSLDAPPVIRLMNEQEKKTVEDTMAKGLNPIDVLQGHPPRPLDQSFGGKELDLLKETIKKNQNPIDVFMGKPSYIPHPEEKAKSPLSLVQAATPPSLTPTTTTPTSLTPPTAPPSLLPDAKPLTEK